MNDAALLELLSAVRCGSVSTEEALQKLRSLLETWALPTHHHRQLRRLPEVVFAQGRRPSRRP